MYKDKRILALIPARGGSKGIKKKNIIDLCGKPLIAYSIECAKCSRYIDDVIVSTDSKEIADISKKYGASVPFMRPSELASDTSKTVDTVLHVIEQLKESELIYDCLVLLQATNPLRMPIDVDCALEQYYMNNEIDLASVSEVDDNPLLIRSISQSGILVPLLQSSSTCRRQDMPKYYKVNGCIYINKISKINCDTSFNDNPLAYVMPKERSVDIDDYCDIELAKYYLSVKMESGNE